MKKFYLSRNRQVVSCTTYSCSLLGLAKAGARSMQAGFSLLELIVVVALLSIVALSATTLIIDNGDLKRQEATETRWNQIHDAIISQPNLYLNGSPYVRGYVADMGRLPVSILELINQDSNFDHDDDPLTPEVLRTYDEDANAGTVEITIDQPDWQGVELYAVNAASGFENTLPGGWRGPYLYTAGSNEFRDGWGREDADADQDAFNFGWNISLGPGEAFPTATELYVQSWGSDQDAGGSGDFTEDFPVDAGQAIVTANEWTINDSPITFNINFSVPFREAAGVDLGNLPLQAGTAQQLVLRIFRYVDNGDNAATYAGITDPDDDVEVVTADAAFTVAVGDPTTKVQTITPLTELPIGRYAGLIYCTNVAVGAPDPLANPNDDIVYDGDCNYDATTNPINHSPVYFTLTNNTSQVTLTWDLP